MSVIEFLQEVNPRLATELTRERMAWLTITVQRNRLRDVLRKMVAVALRDPDRECGAAVLQEARELLDELDVELGEHADDDGEERECPHGVKLDQPCDRCNAQAGGA